MMLICKRLRAHFEEDPVSYIIITATMINMATMICLGEFIKTKMLINLVLLFIIIEFVMEGVRSYVKGCREARGLY